MDLDDYTSYKSGDDWRPALDQACSDATSAGHYRVDLPSASGYLIDSQFNAADYPGVVFDGVGTGKIIRGPNCLDNRCIVYRSNTTGSTWQNLDFDANGFFSSGFVLGMEGGSPTWTAISNIYIQNCTFIDDTADPHTGGQDDWFVNWSGHGDLTNMNLLYNTFSADQHQPLASGIRPNMTQDVWNVIGNTVNGGRSIGMSATGIATIGAADGCTLSNHVFRNNTFINMWRFAANFGLDSTGTNRQCIINGLEIIDNTFTWNAAGNADSSSDDGIGIRIVLGDASGSTVSGVKIRGNTMTDTGHTAKPVGGATINYGGEFDVSAPAPAIEFGRNDLQRINFPVIPRTSLVFFPDITSQQYIPDVKRACLMCNTENQVEIDTNVDTDLDLLDEWTWVFEVYVQDYDADYYLLYKSSASDSPFRVYVNTSGHLVLETESSNTTTTITFNGTAVPMDAWSILAVKMYEDTPSNYKVSLHIDGTKTDDIAYTESRAASGTECVLLNSGLAGSNRFKGMIRSAQAYNGALRDSVLENWTDAETNEAGVDNVVRYLFFNGQTAGLSSNPFGNSISDVTATISAVDADHAFVDTESIF